MTRDSYQNLAGKSSLLDNSSPLQVSRKLARRIAAKERELKSSRRTDTRGKLQADLDELHDEAEKNREIEKAFCNECGGLRDHDIMHARKRKLLREDPTTYFPVNAQDFLLPFVKELNEEERRTFTIQFMVLKCRGCGSEIARQTEYLSVIETWYEDILTNPEVDASFGEEFFQSCFEVTEYPPAIARRRPAWMTRFSPFLALMPEPVGDLMEEIYKALQSGSPRLVAMGVRAVLEQIMVEKTGDHGSFIRNLDGFQAAGYLSMRQRHAIEAILEAGHASIHRAWRPSEEDITVLIDLTESIIETTYLHEPLAKELENRIPKRPPKG